MTGDEMIELHTARATMRPWRMNETDLLFDIRSCLDVAMWLGDATPWTDLATAGDHIGQCATDATLRMPLTLALVPDDTGIPVGSISLFPLDDPAGVSIGWCLHPDAAGAGWAAEGAQGMLDHAVAVGHELVWAMMWEHNHRSAAVCRRIGMTDLGVQVDPWYGTRQYPHSRFFCAGSTADRAGARLEEWGRAAVLEDEPDLVPPPGLASHS